MVILNRIVPIYKKEAGAWHNGIFPTLLPDSFWISAGLVYDFKANTVTKNNRVYQLSNNTDGGTIRIPSIEEWLATEGNKVMTSYYYRASSDNPSGHDNIEYRNFVDSNDVVMYKIHYSWDARDRIVREMSMPCDGNDIIDPEQGDSEAVYTLIIRDSTNPHAPEGGYWQYKHKHGTFVNIEKLRKEIEATRADEGMKLKYVCLNDTVKYSFPDVIEILNDCVIKCLWIPANE